MAKRDSSRWRRWAPNLALLLLSTLVSLGLLEAAIRILAPQQLVMIRPDIWVPRDSVGWGFRPLLDTYVNTGERTVRLVTDGHGYRVAPEGRRQGRKQVLLLGDSFMAAMQVGYEQSFAGILEAKLSELLGLPVEIWNTAVGAWDPPQYRTLARMVLRQQHFDAVVTTVFLGNDMVNRDRQHVPPVQLIERRQFSWPRSLSWQAIVESVLAPLNDQLETSSHAFVLVKRRSEVLLMRLGLTANFFPTALLREKAPSPRWDVTADILADIRREAEQKGLPAIFVLLPSVQQLDENVLRRQAAAFGIRIEDVDAEQPNRLLSQALRRRAIQAIDPLSQFRAAHQKGILLYGRIDPHFSPAGHALLAELVAPTVAATLNHGPVAEGQ